VRACRPATSAFLPPLLLLAATALVLLVDVFVGAPLQIDTAFGYGGGAIVAGRFTGYGNLAGGLLTLSVIAATTGIWGLLQLRRRGGAVPSSRAVAAIGAVYLATVVVTGLPGLGRDVGGVLAIVPGFVIVLAVLTGIRLTWRRLALVGLATVGALAVFGVVDLLRPPEQRGHLGRLIDQTAGEQGTSGLLTVIQRKVDANLTILGSSVWSIVIPVAFAFLAFLIWRPPRTMEALLRLPGVRALLVGSLATCGLAAVLNDSGIAIPGIMLTLLLPYVAHLALELPPTAPRWRGRSRHAGLLLGGRAGLVLARCSARRCRHRCSPGPTTGVRPSRPPRGSWWSRAALAVEAALALADAARLVDLTRRAACRLLHPRRRVGFGLSASSTTSPGAASTAAASPATCGRWPGPADHRRRSSCSAGGRRRRGVLPARDPDRELVVDALLVALAANLANLFDRAPGRTTKVALLALAVLAVAVGFDEELVGVAVVVGAAAALLGADLGERLMLGDTGANVIGAALGFGVVVTATPTARVATAVALLALNLVSEVVSFSRVIDRVAPLRALDRLGRRPAPGGDPSS
jgi:hypothetical protein